MNWKLILGLSVFGLIMAFATISIIPSKVEPICWLIIFTICAYFVSKNAPGKYFLHGFLISLANSIWITLAHVSFHSTYLANHPDEVKMSEQMNMDASVSSMIMMGPLFGAMFGLVLGLFCFVAAKISKKKATA